MNKGRKTDFIEHVHEHRPPTYPKCYSKGLTDSSCAMARLNPAAGLKSTGHPVWKVAAVVDMQPNYFSAHISMGNGNLNERGGEDKRNIRP